MLSQGVCVGDVMSSPLPLRLRDSGSWNKHLQQKLDDTELVFLIIKWYMWYTPVLFPA